MIGPVSLVISSILDTLLTVIYTVLDFGLAQPHSDTGHLWRAGIAFTVGIV